MLVRVDVHLLSEGWYGEEIVLELLDKRLRELRDDPNIDKAIVRWGILHNSRTWDMSYVPIWEYKYDKTSDLRGD